jgi:hypothetical protein
MFLYSGTYRWSAFCLGIPVNLYLRRIDVIRLKNILIQQADMYLLEIDILKVNNKLKPSIENRDKYHEIQGKLKVIKFVLSCLRTR